MGKILFAILTAAAAMAAAPIPASESTLTTEGLGAVQYGMTVAAAENALGARLHINYSEDGNLMSCGTSSRVDGKNADVSYMFENGRVVRIDVFQPDDGAPSKPPVRTAKNIGMGSTEAGLKAAYGTALKIEPHPYIEGTGHYLIVKTADGKRGIIFETDHGKVISFRAGMYPQVGYIEGCA